MNPSQDPRARMARTPQAKLDFAVREMRPEDIPAIRALISRTPGVTLLPSENDTVLNAAIRHHAQGCTVAYLPGAFLPSAEAPGARNDGANLASLGREVHSLVGCCFGVHDGLRSSFRHVAVDPAVQRQGVGDALIKPGFLYFASQGITRTIIQVANDNVAAQSFWLKHGFRLSTERGGIVVSMTKDA